MSKKRVNKYRIPMEKRIKDLGLKMLPWDIETGMNEQYGFDIWNGNSPKTIKRERYMISAAWKQLGESKVHSTSVLDDRTRFKKNPMDDYVVVSKTYEALHDADLLIAHYGDRFDLPFFNARAIFHGLKPLPNIKTVDTCQVAKRIFKFNSNQLGYLAQYLGYGGKINTSIEMWLGCMSGKAGSVKSMLKYNKEDIRVLENVYYELLPYVPTKFNFGLFSDDPSAPSCPVCGSHHVIKNGYYPNVTTLVQRLACKDCGKSFHGPTKRGDDGKVIRAHYR